MRSSTAPADRLRRVLLAVVLLGVPLLAASALRGQVQPAGEKFPPELVKFVQKRVKAGRYNSASEVVRDALRKELEAEEHRNEMDRLIDEGRASGRSIDGEKAFKQIWAYIAKRKKERAARRTSTKKAA